MRLRMVAVSATPQALGDGARRHGSPVSDIRAHGCPQKWRYGVLEPAVLIAALEFGVLTYCRNAVKQRQCRRPTMCHKVSAQA